MNKMTQIEDEFQAIWDRFSPELRSTGGKVEMQVPSTSVGNTRILTTVIRVCPELYPPISEVVSAIQAAYPQHYYYPLNDLHFTVLNCMSFLLKPEELEPEDITRVAKRLGEVFNSFEPISVQLRGLNVFPTTVFIQVFDSSGVITEMRQQIRNHLAEYYWNREMEGKLLLPNPILSFTNLIRFRRQVPPEFVDQIGKYRGSEFGSCRLNAVELVTTDKLLSKENTTIWGRYELS